MGLPEDALLTTLLTVEECLPCEPLTLDCDLEDLPDLTFDLAFDLDDLLDLPEVEVSLPVPLLLEVLPSAELCEPDSLNPSSSCLMTCPPLGVLVTEEKKVIHFSFSSS